MIATGRGLGFALAVLAACVSSGSERSSATAGRSLRGSPSPVHPWCGGASGTSPTTFLLTADSIGPLSHVTSRAGLRSLCPYLHDTTWYGAEGIPVRATVLSFLGRDVGLLEWQGDSLDRVIVTDTTIRTSDALGVGSRVEELREHLGDLSAGYDDAGVYVWSTSLPNVSFLVAWHVTSVLSVPDDISSHPMLVPDTAAVRLVLVRWR